MEDCALERDMVDVFEASRKSSSSCVIKSCEFADADRSWYEFVEDSRTLMAGSASLRATCSAPSISSGAVS